MTETKNNKKTESVWVKDWFWRWIVVAITILGVLFHFAYTLATIDNISARQEKITQILEKSATERDTLRSDIHSVEIDLAKLNESRRSIDYRLERLERILEKKINKDKNPS